MKILVLEYVTGGGLAGEPLPPILADAEVMRQAQLRDLAAVAGVDLLTMLDARLSCEAPLGTRVQRVGQEPGAFDAAWHSALLEADAVWLTAPETDGLLETLSRRVLAAGRRLLGCTPEAVRIATSKRATAALLNRAGIASVPAHASAAAMDNGPVVVKPDDGAGCQFTHCFARMDEAQQWGETVLGARAIYQPWVRGEALSLALLCAEGQSSLLSVNRQQVSLRDGAFSFDGVNVGAVADADGRYAHLAARIARAMPGLWGHVGVDLLATADGPLVVEVNPRATVAYAGLRRLLRFNPAAALLDLPRLPPVVSAPRQPAAVPSLASTGTLEFGHVGASA